MDKYLSGYQQHRSPIEKKDFLLPTEFLQLEKPFSFSHKVCLMTRRKKTTLLLRMLDARM